MPAESHEVSTAADLASQVRARRVDPVATTSAALARIAGDSRALAAFRRVRRDEALAEAAALADRSDLGELALAGVPIAVKEVAAIAGEYPAGESPSTAEPFAVDSDVVERLRAAGAVLIGTTRTPQNCQFPMTDDADAIVANPWAPRSPPVVRRAAAQLRSPPGSCLWLMARTHLGQYVYLLRCAAWWVSHREPAPLPRTTLGSGLACCATVPLRRRFLMRLFCFRCWPNGRNWPRSLRRGYARCDIGAAAGLRRADPDPQAVRRGGRTDSCTSACCWARRPASNTTLRKLDSSPAQPLAGRARNRGANAPGEANPAAPARRPHGASSQLDQVSPATAMDRPSTRLLR